MAFAQAVWRRAPLASGLGVNPRPSGLAQVGGGGPGGDHHRGLPLLCGHEGLVHAAGSSVAVAAAGV